MGRPWMLPARATEATAQQLIATGAYGGGGIDPVDGDVGFRPMGSAGRPLPSWTLEKTRAFSVAAYRTNPMARAILDTYTSFCVGDSGLTLQCTNDQVREVAHEFWTDPKNRLAEQDVMLRSHMLNGESCYEMMIGQQSGRLRRSVIDPSRISAVNCAEGNALWPTELVFRLPTGQVERLQVVQIDDLTGLRTGQVQFWTSWHAQETDVRGEPFLGPVIDWLDNYDMVLSNLIDRTALMRHIAFDVTLKGKDVGQPKIDDFIRARGGTHIPRSGSIEVHNEQVEWKPFESKVGADEDNTTVGNVLTMAAAGAGLAKTWLSDPEHANRATALTMAEPVRRRVGGVQNRWLGFQTDLVRQAVDEAVRVGRLPASVDAMDAGTGQPSKNVPAAETVKVTGPEVAAADAQITATIILQLGQGIDFMVKNGTMSVPAARVLARKAWEEFAGLPYTADLDDFAAQDALAEEIDNAQQTDTGKSAVVHALTG